MTKQNFHKRLNFIFKGRYLDMKSNFDLLMNEKKNKDAYEGEQIFVCPIVLNENPDEMYEVFDDRRQLEYAAFGNEFEQRKEDNKNAKRPILGILG